MIPSKKHSDHSSTSNGDTHQTPLITCQNRPILGHNDLQAFGAALQLAEHALQSELREVVEVRVLFAATAVNVLVSFDSSELRELCFFVFRFVFLTSCVGPLVFMRFQVALMVFPDSERCLEIVPRCGCWLGVVQIVWMLFQDKCWLRWCGCWLDGREYCQQ
jgi:hypothetical protein